MQKLLAQIEAEQPECAAWLALLHPLSLAFQFDGMTPLIQEALAHDKT